MKHFILILLLLSCISINAQNNITEEVSAMDSVFQPKLTGDTYIEFRGYNGSQYLNDSWAKSDILLSTGEMLYNQKIKYNGLLDEVIWLNTAIPGLYKLDRALISDIWLQNIQDNPIHIKRINLYDSTKVYKPDIFAEVAVEGKISLYIQRKISVLDVQTITRDGKLYPYKTIGATPVYYLKLPSDHYFLMNRLSRRSLLKLFPERKKDIIKLQKQNQINLNTERGLGEMIILLNKEVIL